MRMLYAIGVRFIQNSSESQWFLRTISSYKGYGRKGCTRRRLFKQSDTVWIYWKEVGTTWQPL